MYASVRCRAGKDGCRACVDACPYGAVTILENGTGAELNRQLCKHCSVKICESVCRHHALRISGHYYTQQEIMGILRRDRRFWGNGGVTFGGGEPFMQGEFLLDMLKCCRNEGIHTALETCGYAGEELFLTVMANVDFAFVDVKHMDPEKHREKTGKGNEVILNNLRAFGRIRGEKPRLILRMPVIPEYNDSVENAHAMIFFMKENGLEEINLLPFHRLGSSKWEQLGLIYPYRDQPNRNAEDLNELQEIYLKEGIVCYVDSYVLYEE